MNQSNLLEEDLLLCTSAILSLHHVAQGIPCFCHCVIWMLCLCSLPFAKSFWHGRGINRAPNRSGWVDLTVPTFHHVLVMFWVHRSAGRSLQDTLKWNSGMWSCGKTITSWTQSKQWSFVTRTRFVCVPFWGQHTMVNLKMWGCWMTCLIRRTRRRGNMPIYSIPYDCFWTSHILLLFALYKRPSKSNSPTDRLLMLDTLLSWCLAEQMEHSYSRGCCEWGFCRSIFVPRACLGLPSAPSEEHQREWPQIRSCVCRDWMGCVEG